MVSKAMRMPWAAILTIFFAWNSILGGMDALVVCMHTEGEAHLVLLGDGAGNDFTEHDHAVGTWMEPPCTDFMLKSADLGPIFLPDPVIAVAPVHHGYVHCPRPYRSNTVASCARSIVLLPRSPPMLEHHGALIRRAVVLQV